MAADSYRSFTQLVKVRLEDVELDALEVTFERDATDQQNDEHHVWEECSEVDDLSKPMLTRYHA